MPTLYFGSDNVKSPTQQAYPAKDLAEFFRRLSTNLPILPITFDAYHALPKAGQSEFKVRLPYFTPCTFPNSPWRGGRTNQNAGPCNLIILDVDDSGDALRLEQPEALSKAMAGMSWFAYRTASHTPAKPRMRVVISAHKIPPARYADAVRTVAKRLELKQVTPESLTPSQPMFVPCLFEGQDLDWDDPTIATSLDGQAFTEADIEESHTFESDATQDDNMEDKGGLEYLRSPLAGYTPAMVTEMLSKLDPDMPRAEWLKVAAALKHQFSADPEQGYELFETWSGTAKSKYDGPESTRKLWDSLEANPTDRQPVTLATVLQMAEKGRGQQRTLVNQAQAVSCDVIRPLPRICGAADLIESEGRKPRPQVLVAGLLHIGEKLLLAGASKSYKSWALLDLAVSVGAGLPFWGLPTTKGRVLLLNYEIRPYFFAERLRMVQKAKSCTTLENVDVWNLRGHRAGFDRVLAELREMLKTTEYALIIIDPLYSGLAGRSENDAAEMAAFMNNIEVLAECGPAVALGHHFAKGNSAMRESLDRASGSGVFARDPDGIVTLNRHQSADAFVAEFTVRNFPPVDRIGLRLDFPLLVPDGSLDLDMIKGAQVRKTVTATAEDIVRLLPEVGGLKATELQSKAAAVLLLGKTKFYDLLKEAQERELILRTNRLITRAKDAQPSAPLDPEIEV